MPKYLENMLHAIDQKDILITGFTMCRLENRERLALLLAIRQQRTWQER